MKITLAFDIERSGATDQYQTIAIGASIVDEKFQELDSLFLLGYFPDDTTFEPRCWNEFWSKHPDTLKTLEYNGPLTMEDRQREMITLFQDFRRKWEAICQRDELDYMLVSDNNVYDGGFINLMIFKYLPGTLPLPYSASVPQSYESYFETHSLQKIIAQWSNKSFTQDWGFSQEIEKLFNLPEAKKSHDHNPANDVYRIAYDYQICCGIIKGSISKK